MPRLRKGFSNRLASAPHVIFQGISVGRSGRVYIRQDWSGQVWVGGRTQTLSSGIARLDPDEALTQRYHAARWDLVTRRKDREVHISPPGQP